MYVRSISFTPAISASPDYSDLDQLGILVKLADVLPASSGTVNLMSVTIVDAAKQSKATDLLFFNKAITVASADNAALDVTAAQMKANFIGRVSIAATDYVSTANTAEATKANINLVMSGGVDGDNDLWVMCQSRSTGNYAAVDDLVITCAFAVYQG